MGGIAAVAGALGPTIGGVLTSAISWRAVLLINLPLLVLTVFFTLRAVPPDEPREGRVRVDLTGAVLLCLTLVGLVFGLAQSTRHSGVTSMSGGRCWSAWRRAFSSCCGSDGRTTR